jgi:hypothetical protein
MLLKVKKKQNSILSPLFILTFLFTFGNVLAADISPSPSSQIVEEGRSFVVSVELNNNSTSVNGLTAKMMYPSDLLKAVSISKSGSVVEMWPQEPDIRSEIGAIPFEGIILNPGFSGSNGLIYKVTFLPLAKGTARVYFSSGNVFANDGEATDVLSSLGSATYTIKERTTKDIAEEVKESVRVKPNTPSDIKITSPTHAREESWYAKREVLYNFLLDNEATDISYQFGLSSDLVSRQRVLATSSLAFFAKKDGVYQIKIKQKVGGVWREDSLFTTRVDTKVPYDVTSKLSSPKVSSKVFQTVELMGKDETSGISHFEVRLNGGSARTIKADASGRASVTLPKASFGENSLIISAFDFANNQKTIEERFTVTALDVPQVRAFTKTIKQGDALMVSGSTYPNASVKVVATRKNVLFEKVITANEYGDFFVSELLSEAGLYELQIMVEDFEGGQSALVTTGNVKVKYDVFALFTKYGVGALALALFTLLVAMASSLKTKSVIKKRSGHSISSGKRSKLKSFFSEEKIKAFKAKVKHFLSNNEV